MVIIQEVITSVFAGGGGQQVQNNKDACQHLDFISQHNSESLNTLVEELKKKIII